MPPSKAERLVSAYLDHLVVEKGSSPHTVAAYRRDLTKYLEYLAGRGIDDLARVTDADTTALGRWLTETKHLAPSSVARTLAAVRGLHAFAVTEGVTGTNPAAAAKAPQMGQRLPKALPVGDVQALIDSADRDTVEGLRDACLLELLYGTGARISEVCALDVDDVQGVLADPDTGLRLLGKGRKERIVPVGSFARAALEAWLVRGRPAWAGVGDRAAPALLLNSRGGRLSRQSGWQVLRRAAERAGIAAEVSPHTLRHSFATHLLDGGADVRVVQELLGHASVTTTQIYTLVTVDHLREIYLTSHPRAY